MAITVPQTTYTLRAPLAMAGMTFGADPGQLVDGKYLAGEVILPGLVVEMDPSDNTKCRLPQTASAVGRLLGVAMYSSARAPGGYQIGEAVQILVRGSIYATFSGTAGSDNGTNLNVYSSSTIATNRGKLTDVATSASSGVEIYATKMIAQQETDATNLANLVLVRLNGAIQ